jgi:hypothetical protein
MEEVTLGQIADAIYRKRGALAWTLWYVFIFFICMIFQPSMFEKRQPVPDRYVDQGTQQRLAPWLNHIEHIEFQFIDTDPNRPASCAYSNGHGPFRTDKVFVYTHDIRIDEWEWQAAWCVKHEIGHHIDRESGMISNSKQFQYLVNRSIIMFYEQPPNTGHWWGTGRMIVEFPGVNGNPLNENGWGGYGELYAKLHEVDYLIQIPPPLQVYFKDYIRWIWH